MLKEHHPLPICVFTSPTNDHFWGSGVGVGGAFGDFVGAPACGAPVVLPLPGALRHYVSHLLAPEAPDNLAVVCVIAMEDRHLHSSPSTRREWHDCPNYPWCFYKGRLDRGMARAQWDGHGLTKVAVQLLVGVANLQPLFTEVQLAVHHYQFLHNLHHPSLGVSHQLLQHVMEIAQTPIVINFPMEFGVIHWARAMLIPNSLSFPFLKCFHLSGVMGW